jgi:hypothetical protein
MAKETAEKEHPDGRQFDPDVNPEQGLIDSLIKATKTEVKITDAQFVTSRAKAISEKVTDPEQSNQIFNDIMQLAQDIRVGVKPEQK